MNFTIFIKQIRLKIEGLVKILIFDKRATFLKKIFCAGEKVALKKCGLKILIIIKKLIP